VNRVGELQPRRVGCDLDEPHVEWRVVEEDWAGFDKGEKGFHSLGQGAALLVNVVLSNARQFGDC